MTRIHAIAGSGLGKSYSVSKGLFGKKETFQALNNISFTLLEGDTLGVLGETGAGKSTFANILVGSETPTEGILLIDNKDVTKIKIHPRLSHHRKVRMVYQDPYASLNPRLTISSLLEEPLKNITRLDKFERKERIIEVLNLVGLKSEHGRRLPHMFSPGERQRIAIARALILDPVCIVLDEPLSALDISVQSQIINLMLELQSDLGLSYILITHNLPVLRHMCDQLMVLCKGQMVEYGPTKAILDNPIHPYTKDLLNKKSKTLTINDASFSGCVYSERCTETNEQCINEKPTQQLIDGRLVCCHKVIENNSN